MAANAEEMAPGRSSLCSRSGWLTWGAPVKGKECREAWVVSDSLFFLSVHSY